MGEAIHTMQPQCMQRNWGLVSDLLPGLLSSLAFLNLKHSSEEKHTSMQQMWRPALCICRRDAGQVRYSQPIQPWIKVAAAIMFMH